MAGPFDFLHIKGRTEGSSNELSFDVLDAARTDADNKNRNSRVSSGIKLDQGSYHGVAGTATFSAAPEVARRKQARRAHTRRTAVVAIIAILALVGTGVYFGYLYYQSKADFSGRINDLVSRFVEIDETVVEVDQLMQDFQKMVDVEASTEGVDSSASNAPTGLTAEAQNAMEKIPALKKELNSISADAQKLKEVANLNEEKAALSQVEAAAVARVRMFEVGEEALDVAKLAGKRTVELNDAWGKVLKADELARSAAEAANEADTEETTLDARKISEEARVLFVEAKEDLEVIEIAKPKLDLSKEKEYVVKRAESLEAAVKTANALLANNREGAIAANNAYNEADKEAALLAHDLPTTEGLTVMKAYEKQFRTSAEAYDESRAAAATADSVVRSYLDNH